MRNKVAITEYKITIATYKDAILRNKVTIKSDINSQLPKKWFPQAINGFSLRNWLMRNKQSELKAMYKTFA